MWHHCYRYLRMFESSIILAQPLIKVIFEYNWLTSVVSEKTVSQCSSVFSFGHWQKHQKIEQWHTHSSVVNNTFASYVLSKHNFAWVYIVTCNLLVHWVDPNVPVQLVVPYFSGNCSEQLLRVDLLIGVSHCFQHKRRGERWYLKVLVHNWHFTV